jgi:TRAP-type C4-dicarboxylate transport system substrate-binding protein
MKRQTVSTKVTALGIALTMILILVFTAGPVMARTLKIQSAFPHGDLSMDLLKEFAAAVEKNSSGKINVKVFADPEIVPMDQLFGATKRGVVDMLQCAGVIWQGIVPAAGVEFGLPMAYRIEGETDFAKQAEAIRDFFFKEGAMEVMRAEYAKHGLYFLDIHTYGPVPFMLATKPYKNCADLNGKKIRTDGILHAYFGGVGMQGASISGLEAYMALKLGTVDAAEWDVSAVTGLKWNEVAPYWIRGMENNHCIGHILINMKTWEKFTADEKKAMQAAGEAYWKATVAGYGQELENVRGLIKDGKLTEIILDQACQAKFKEVAYQLWDQVAKEDETSAKMVQLLKKWRGDK